MTTKKNHAERAHSKYSASGAERWFNCSASVELSEGLPDKSSPWAEEGTQAHEVLEQLMIRAMKAKVTSTVRFCHDVRRYFMSDEYEGKPFKVPDQMMNLGVDAANFILSLGKKLDAQTLVETRIYLKFIHPEMFGTFDGAVIDHFATLHVFDYKYGAGHAVAPARNLQMIFYGIGLAHLHDWNFKRVRLWIIQPRIKGYNGPMFWEMTTAELKAYVPLFEEAVERVETNPELVEGSWCHWCKAKSICPLKRDKKLNEAKLLFSPTGRVSDGEDEEENFEEKDEERVSRANEKSAGQGRAKEKSWEEKSRDEKLESLFASKEEKRLEEARKIWQESADAARDGDFF